MTKQKKDDYCKIISSKRKESEFSRISYCCRKTVGHITNLIFFKWYEPDQNTGMRSITRKLADHIHIIFKDFSIVNPEGFQIRSSTLGTQNIFREKLPITSKVKIWLIII